jgi:hypothetical protein
MRWERADFRRPSAAHRRAALEKSAETEAIALARMGESVQAALETRAESPWAAGN